ncbi:MAG: hypothetical protein RL385_3808 [Pseudomonadota bacterium]
MKKPLAYSLLLLISACAERQVVVRTSSSADAAGYAAAYPERIAERTATLKTDAQKARSLNAELAGRDRDLPADVDSELLLAIVEAADKTGRSEAYVAADHEARTVRGFWEEERGVIVGRATNAAQKQATDAGCPQELDVGPQLSHAVKDGIEKQLEKRLRESSEASRILEAHKAALGPANAQRIQKVADDVTYASYLVNVAVVEDRDSIEHLNRERGDVESALRRALEDEQHFREHIAKTPAEKRVSEERTARLEKSRVALAPEGAKAEAAVRDLDPAVQQARDEYENALQKLLDALRARRDKSAQRSH